MEFGNTILLRLVGVLKLILILFCPFNIQGVELYLCDHCLSSGNQFLRKQVLRLQQLIQLAS